MTYFKLTKILLPIMGKSFILSAPHKKFVVVVVVVEGCLDYMARGW